MVNMEDYFIRLQKAAAKGQKSAANGHTQQNPKRKKSRRSADAEDYPLNPS